MASTWLKYRLIRKSKKIQLHQKSILSAVIEWKNGLVGCLIAQKEKRTMEGGGTQLTSPTMLYKVIVKVEGIYGWSPHVYLTPAGGKSVKVATFANSEPFVRISLAMHSSGKLVTWRCWQHECDDEISLRQWSFKITRLSLFMVITLYFKEDIPPP